MKLIIRFTLIILGGFTLTVVVAWGCLTYAPVQKRAKMKILKADAPMAVSIRRFGDFELFGLFVNTGFGWHEEYVIASYGKYSSGSPYNDNSLDHIRGGWPWLCLQGERREVHSKKSTWRVLDATGMPWRRSPVGVVVYDPIWPGMIANAALYSGSIAVVWFGVIGMIRWRRVRRGRCLQCGYDLRGLAEETEMIRCPECGKPAKSRRLRRRG